jgi:hypothetical protein
MKIKDLKVALKSFNKEDLLVVFAPATCDQSMLCELFETIATLKIENEVLILPDDFDVKKIEVAGIENKKVGNVEIKDGTVCIKFVDK